MKLKMLAFVLCLALTALVGCGGGGGPLDVCKQYHAAMEAGDMVTAFGLVTPDLQKQQLEGTGSMAALACMDMSDGSMDDDKVKSLNTAVDAFGVKLEDSDTALSDFGKACAGATDRAGLFAALHTWTKANSDDAEGEGEADASAEKGVITWGTVTQTETAASVEATEKKGDREMKITISLAKIEGKWLVSGFAGAAHSDDDDDGHDHANEDNDG